MTFITTISPRAPHRRGALTLLAGALIGALIGAAPAHAGAQGDTDPRWLAWVGCWAPSGASEDAAATVAGVERVCVTPVDRSNGVDVVNVRDGRVITRVRVEATDVRRPVSREGCTGWETVRWSADNERVFLRSELTCSGSISRSSSGIIAVASPSDWVDVQVIAVGDQQSTRVVRYRSVGDSSMLAREISAAVRDRELARQTGRLAAASTPTIADIAEASQQVHAAVVEAWLLQRMPRLTVDKRALRQLADARTPATVVDLVIALGEPARFPERLTTRGYTFMRIDPPRPATVSVVAPSAYEQSVLAPESSVGGLVTGSVTGSVTTIEIHGTGRYRTAPVHSHHDGCGHYDSMGYLYGYNPWWPYAGYTYSSGYGYYPYAPYGYYPYTTYNSYRPEPREDARPRGQTLTLPERRATRVAPAPSPDPGPQPQAEGGRIVKGGGYTRPATDPSASRPAAARGSAGSAPRGAVETKPARPATTPVPPQSEPRTATRRPPSDR